jgi:hypothetical protein
MPTPISSSTVSPSSSSRSVSCIPPKLCFHLDIVEFGHRELEFELLWRGSLPVSLVCRRRSCQSRANRSIWRGRLGSSPFPQSNKTIPVTSLEFT